VDLLKTTQNSVYLVGFLFDKKRENLIPALEKHQSCWGRHF